MKTQWKKIWVKATMWVITEIALNLLGLDNLADYSEFIYEQESAIATYQNQMTVVTLLHRPQFYQTLPYRFVINA
jgi:hypothetical protein